MERKAFLIVFERMQLLFPVTWQVMVVMARKCFITEISVQFSDLSEDDSFVTNS
jgi:hypothetical protein